MTYTIISKSTNNDGSFITNVQYNINDTIITQNVVHAPGSQLSDILSGIINMGNIFNQQMLYINNAPSILETIVLNQEITF